MEKGLVRYSRYTLLLLAMGVAVQSFRYAAVPWHIVLGVDDAIRGVMERVPLQFLTHAIVAPIALLVGPLQFFPRLRSKYPRLHRWNGRLYVLACVVAGIAALATAPYASGGPVAGLGFSLLAVSWLATTIGGWRAAVARKFDLHRVLMRFSYALTFAAVTLRIQLPIGFIFLGFHSYREMSVYLAYTSWIPNVIVVALYSLAMGWRGAPTTITAPQS